MKTTVKIQLSFKIFDTNIVSRIGGETTLFIGVLLNN
jgi:hypothetical protein